MKLRFDLRGFVRKMLERLRQIRDAPHAVAGGVAVGIFWGFSPFTGLKTLLSLGTAWGFRFSRIAAVIAVSLHDLLLPLWPVILRWEYQIGFWIFSHPHHFPPKLAGHFLHWDNIFSAHMATVLWKTFAGAVVIGLPIALGTYWLTLVLLARYEAKHHVRLKPPP